MAMAVLSISAGTNLSVSNYLIANGTGSGTGGTIDLTSNSTTPFVIGTGVTTNGVNGFLGVVGQTGVNGTINVTNNGGAIIDNALMYFFNTCRSLQAAQARPTTLPSTNSSVSSALTPSH